MGSRKQGKRLPRRTFHSLASSPYLLMYVFFFLHSTPSHALCMEETKRSTWWQLESIPRSEKSRNIDREVEVLAKCVTRYLSPVTKGHFFRSEKKGIEMWWRTINAELTKWRPRSSNWGKSYEEEEGAPQKIGAMVPSMSVMRGNLWHLVFSEAGTSCGEKRPSLYDSLRDSIAQHHSLKSSWHFCSKKIGRRNNFTEWWQDNYFLSPCHCSFHFFCNWLRGIKNKKGPPLRSKI